MESWKRGLKGITVYVEGSRSGVLITDNTKDNNKFEYKDAVKRPKSIPCDIYHMQYKGTMHTILVGILDNKPYEVFAIENSIAKNYTTGKLSKESGGKYNLITSDSMDDNSSIVHIDTNITSSMSDEQAVITRLISTSLRHGANIKFIVEQLQKTDGELTSYTKAISRVLKKYIIDGEKSTVKCDNCGSSNVIFKEGCSSCQECGNSKCS